VRRVIFAIAFFGLLCAGRASASALGDFSDAWSKVDNYSCSIVVHEALGTQTQDRRYDFWFKKPSLAHIEITSGPGRGSGSVWHGGDTVLGHQGGLLRGIKMNVSINDSRAVSLRGDTITAPIFGNILATYQSNMTGTVTESPGETIDGAPTDMLTLKIANPAANKNVTRDVLYLSKTTHLPVRRMRYEGDTLVKQEDFVNVKINPGLKDSDF
jgi:outer membrane lipoprotein-sorting protein